MTIPGLILLLFIFLCIIGIPIGFAIGFTTWAAFLLLDGKMMVLSQKLFTGLNSFSYLCIPLFILAAEIMSKGNLIRKIVDFFNVLIGHIRGGLAYVNVLSSMVFAGISGSASGDMASIGLIMTQTMDEAGYDRTYSTVVSASSATIAPIIPPSTIMIIFAAAAGGISVGKLFAGGFLPGVIYGTAMIGLCAFYARRDNQPKTKRHSLAEIWTEFKSAFYVLLLPAIILGSIVTGVCTATEAGAIAVLYALIVTFAKKQMTVKLLSECLYNAARLTASVAFIIATASAMGWVVSALQIPQKLALFSLQYIHSPFAFLVFINVLLLIVGCLLDGAPAVLLLVPILYPVAMNYGINPIHFAIVTCLNLTIGLITPPIGLVLFVASNVTGVKLSDLYRRVWPFVIVEIIVLLLITYIPFLSTWIPGMMK